MNWSRTQHLTVAPQQIVGFFMAMLAGWLPHDSFYALAFMFVIIGLGVFLMTARISNI